MSKTTRDYKDINDILYWVGQIYHEPTRKKTEASLLAYIEEKIGPDETDTRWDPQWRNGFNSAKREVRTAFGIKEEKDE